MSKKIIFSTSEISSILKEYEDGISCTKIARDFKVSISCIYRLLKSQNCVMKSPSHAQIKYPIDENFFDEINTEEKAYFLGFLYADGYNNEKTHNVVLNLKEEDKEILIKLNNLIQPTKSLYKRNMFNQRLVKGYEKCQNQLVLTIQNKHISKQLAILGCFQRKSLCLKFPTVEQVPAHLQNHFIRGYFDGDGSVNNGILKVSFISSEEFLFELQNIFKKELTFSITKLFSKSKEDKIKILTVGGRLQCLSLKEYLYKNATIFLQRKKIIFDTLYI